MKEQKPRQPKPPKKPNMHEPVLVDIDSGEVVSEDLRYYSRNPSKKKPQLGDPFLREILEDIGLPGSMEDAAWRYLHKTDVPVAEVRGGVLVIPSDWEDFVKTSLRASTNFARALACGGVLATLARNPAEEKLACDVNEDQDDEDTEDEDDN